MKITQGIFDNIKTIQNFNNQREYLAQYHTAYSLSKGLKEKLCSIILSCRISLVLHIQFWFLSAPSHNHNNCQNGITYRWLTRDMLSIYFLIWKCLVRLCSSHRKAWTFFIIFMFNDTVKILNTVKWFLSKQRYYKKWWLMSKLPRENKKVLKGIFDRKWM